MWLTKHLISPVKIRIFAQNRPNLAQNRHVCLFWARPCRMDGMVVIGQWSSMSTFGANNTKSNFSNQEDAHIILNFKKTYTCYYLNSFAIPWLFAYLCKSKLPPPTHQLNGELQSTLDWRSGPRITLI